VPPVPPAPPGQADASGSEASAASAASTVSSSARPQMVALRLWLVVLDPLFDVSRLVGLQLLQNARLHRQMMVEPPGRAGSSKRKRQEVEEAAEKKASRVPDPMTARQRVRSTSDWVYCLHRYTDDGQEPLACGDLERQLNAGKGSAHATSLLDPLEKNASLGNARERSVHVASPECTLRLSRAALAANLHGLGVQEKYLATRSYVGPADVAFRMPNKNGAWLLVPESSSDAVTTPLPRLVRVLIKAAQKRGVCGGLCGVSGGGTGAQYHPLPSSAAMEALL